MSLRRRQYEAALSGSVAMLIWLGKQYLSQTDKIAPTSPDGEKPYNPDVSQQAAKRVQELLQVAELRKATANANGEASANGHES